MMLLDLLCLVCRCVRVVLRVPLWTCMHMNVCVVRDDSLVFQ